MKKFLAITCIAGALILCLLLAASTEPSVTSSPASRNREYYPIHTFPPTTSPPGLNLMMVDFPVAVAPTGSTNLSNFTLDKSQVVHIEGEIGPEALDTAKQIVKLGKNNKPIFVLINSPGGSVMDGAQIIAAIQSSPVPVTTICTQLCASMAAIIHQYGTERAMVDRSILMFHSASGGVRGTLEHMNSLLSTLTRYIYKMDNYIATRSGQTLEQFHEKTIRDFWVDAEDATAQKLNDKVVSVTVPGEESAFDATVIKFKLPNITKELFNLDWK